MMARVITVMTDFSTRVISMMAQLISVMAPFGFSGARSGSPLVILVPICRPGTILAPPARPDEPLHHRTPHGGAEIDNSGFLNRKFASILRPGILTLNRSIRF